LLAYFGSSFTGLLLIVLVTFDFLVIGDILLSSEFVFTFSDETILKKFTTRRLIFTCVCEDWRLPWNSYNLGAAA